MSSGRNPRVRVPLGSGSGSSLSASAFVQTLLSAVDAAAFLLTLYGGTGIVSVAYAATVTPNADTTDILNIGTLTGNITIAAPTGTPKDGQTIQIRFVQDATGTRIVTWNAAFAFGTDVTAALEPTTANAKWERLFTWNALDSKWRPTAIVRGF